MSLASKFSWYLHRLRAMDAGEILGRAKHHWLQLREPAGIARLQQEKLGSTPRDFPKLPPKESASAELRDAIAQDAAEILAGRWKVLHGQTWQVAAPPDWHKDHHVSLAAPTRTPARKLNHRQLPQGMDVRLIWETSRWTQITRLAQNAWLNADNLSAEAAVAWLENWLVENPLGLGWNWTSPMEPGLRLINFTWIDALLVASDLVDASRWKKVVDAIVPSHVWWVWRYHSIGSSANNHLLGELTGLLMASARWPEATRWCARPEQLTTMATRCILEQFGSDGANREEALHYHLFAWEMAWSSLRSAEACGVGINPAATQRLGAAARFFVDLVMPEEPWDFGDSDDAHIAPFYNREECALAEWQSWLLGKNSAGFGFWCGSPPEMSAAPRQLGAQGAIYPDSGYAMQRSGPFTARFDASALGFGKMAAHGHLDPLHVSLWWNQIAVLIDPGTGGYFASKELRATLTSRQAHNGPHIETDAAYPVRRGPFLWTNHHAKPILDSGAELGAELPLGPHRLRRTLSMTPESVRIIDSSPGAATPFKVHWQFSPDWRLEQSSPREFQASHPQTKLTIRFSGEAFGEAKIEDAVCSPAFRQVAQSQRIACRSVANPGTHILETLILAA